MNRKWKDRKSAPRDGKPFWACKIGAQNIYLMEYVTPERTARELGGKPEDYNGVFASAVDHSDQPFFDCWIEGTAIYAPRRIEELEESNHE